MEMKQLKAVLAVADTGSVTRASHLLHIAQPAVTRHIKALESELGVPLFQRTYSGMVVTHEGETLVTYARRIVSELDEAKTMLNHRSGAVRGVVRIGILDSVTDLVAEPLVAELAGRHPEISLQIRSAFAGHLRNWLYDGSLDLSVLFGVADPSVVQLAPVATEKLWAMAPRSASLDPDVPVDVAEVARNPMIAPSKGHSLRTLIDEAAVRADVSPRFAVEVNASRLALQLVSRGHGWTILPAVCLSQIDASWQLSSAPLSDPLAVRQLALATPRTHRVTSAVKIVAAVLMKQMRQAADEGRWPSATTAGENAGGDRQS